MPRRHSRSPAFWDARGEPGKPANCRELFYCNGVGRPGQLLKAPLVSVHIHSHHQQSQARPPMVRIRALVPGPGGLLYAHTFDIQKMQAYTREQLRAGHEVRSRLPSRGGAGRYLYSTTSSGLYHIYYLQEVRLGMRAIAPRQQTDPLHRSDPLRYLHDFERFSSAGSDIIEDRLRTHPWRRGVGAAVGPNAANVNLLQHLQQAVQSEKERRMYQGRLYDRIRVSDFRRILQRAVSCFGKTQDTAARVARIYTNAGIRPSSRASSPRPAPDEVEIIDLNEPIIEEV